MRPRMTAARQYGIEPEKGPGEPGDEHPDRQELGLRKVHDPHHAVDQRESDRDHRIDAADQEPVEDGLDKGHGCRDYSVKSFDRIALPLTFTSPRLRGEVDLRSKSGEGGFPKAPM